MEWVFWILCSVTVYERHAYSHLDSAFVLIQYLLIIFSQTRTTNRTCIFKYRANYCAANTTTSQTGTPAL